MKKLFCTVLIISLWTHSTFTQNIPNDPLYEWQWSLGTIGLPAVWLEFTKGGVTADGDTIVVAVIDGEFDLNYNDLSFWKNRNEIPNNGIDDDNNGYMDDYDGWDAYNLSNVISRGGPDDHGTTIARIIGAKGNNGIGMCGVNWDVKILPVCGSSPNINYGVRAAVNYVIKMRQRYHETGGQEGAFIVAANFSFGPYVNANLGTVLPAWFQLFDDLGSVGILSCQATGNDTINFNTLGISPNTLSRDHHIFVTNTTRYDTKYPDANYGNQFVDIGAPGLHVFPNGGEGSATSFAAPHVAGVIALMYAAMPPSMIQAAKSDPANFAKSVKDSLLNGADHVSALDPYVISGRRLNAYNAVKAVACPPIVNFTGTLSAPITVTSNTTKESCGDINVQYVTVTNGATLTLQATGDINIQYTTVTGNSTLVLDAGGEINIIRDFEVELGSELEMK